MSEPFSGHITREGSRDFAQFALKKGAVAGHLREFRSLALTSLGMGTYLGDTNSETDKLVEQAVYSSVSSGAINVIDTAINYRLQKAERSVGRALRRLFEDGVAKREQIFVSTKNGYLTADADSPVDFWEYIHKELVKPGKLKPEEIAGEAHSMSVPFLRDQFERSLKNLGLQAVDLLYLHNAAESWVQEVGVRRFLEKLEPVFASYEEDRKRGRLLFYGLATWSSLRVHKDDPEHVNLDDVVEVAKMVGGDEHGLRFIQLPLNIAMSEALFSKNQRIADEPLTVLEAAHRLGMGVFTSAPLGQGRLTHHSRLPVVGNSKVLSLLQFARSSNPAVIAPLIGQKEPQHLEENLRLARIPPLSVEEFDKFYASILGQD
jgi:aryl-alcohol dehydrogenase-like predicted oxidoreductase